MSDFHENETWTTVNSRSTRLTGQIPLNFNHEDTSPAVEFVTEKEDPYEEAIRKMLLSLERKYHLFSVNEKTVDDLFDSATHFFSQLAWLSQKKAYFKNIYREHQDNDSNETFESFLPDYFSEQDIKDERRYYLIFRILKSYSIFERYSTYYVKNKTESTWRHILFVLLLCAYYNVRGQHGLVQDNLRGYGLSRGVLQ